MVLNDLMIKTDFVPEDILQLTDLLISKAETNKMLRLIHCGACEKGVFIPVLQGYVHPDQQVFDKSKLQLLILMICSYCRYIYKERIFPYKYICLDKTIESQSQLKFPV